MQLHSQTRLLCLLGLGVAFFVAGCQPEVERPPAEVAVAGQVFIVVPTGESLRLGSVRVQFFDEERIDGHLQERDREIAGRRESLKQDLTGLETLLAERRIEIAEAEAAYRRRDAEIRQELRAFLDEAEARVAAFQKQIEANTTFIASSDSLPPPPEGIPSREESEAYEARRKKWLSMNREERFAWAEALASLNTEMEAEIDGLEEARDEKLRAFGDELQQLDRAIEAAEKAAQEAREAIVALTTELARPPVYGDYLAGLPSPAREVRTDADGEFAVVLSAKRGYVVFAEAERKIGGEQRRFTWFVRMNDTNGSRMLLSNHNLIETEARENVIDLSARPPNSRDGTLSAK